MLLTTQKPRVFLGFRRSPPSKSSKTAWSLIRHFQFTDIREQLGHRISDFGASQLERRPTAHGRFDPVAEAARCRSICVEAFVAANFVEVVPSSPGRSSRPCSAHAAIPFRWLGVRPRLRRRGYQHRTAEQGHAVPGPRADGDDAPLSPGGTVDWPKPKGSVGLFGWPAPQAVARKGQAVEVAGGDGDDVAQTRAAL